MKVFLDTNVLLDYLEQRKDFYEDALAIFRLAALGKIEILVTDLSFANIKYITRKTISLDVFYDVMCKLKKYVTIVPVGNRAVEESLLLRAKDFEDSLQYFAALYAHADVLVTRNIKDFVYPNLQIMDSHTFVEEWNQKK